MKRMISLAKATRSDRIALALRVGIGAVLIIGGWNKLSQMIDPALRADMIATYLGPQGYINAFFADYLFTGIPGMFITPQDFLTTLSAFEVLSGLALVVGLAVRPLALLYGFMMWTFVVALPVTVSPDIDVSVNTYTTPAALVMARDIALSGLMFVLYNLGAGRHSVDRMLSTAARRPPTDWQNLALLLRLALALALMVGGFFHGVADIQSFAAPAWLLIPLGLLILGGVASIATGLMVCALMVWFAVAVIEPHQSLIANLNGFKREFALLAGGLVLAYAGGGDKFAVPAWLARLEELTAPWPPEKTGGRGPDKRARI